MTSAPFCRVLVAAVLLGATAADAATILVTPGPDTPVQDAIDAAAPGDVVRLAGGDYPETIVITKPLTLTGPAGTVFDAQPQAAALTAGCAGTTGITVQADGVRIRDLRVMNFTQFGIDVQGRDKFNMRNVVVIPNCPADPPLYSVNVVASTRVKIDRSNITNHVIDGGSGVALHLGGIAARGNVRVTRTLAGYHTIGIFLEGCAERSVSIAGSYANFNETGILLQDSDGIELKKNQVAQNSSRGISVDANSDGNRITGNKIDGSTTDVSDAGTGNCWKKNQYTTGSVSPCP